MKHYSVANMFNWFEDLDTTFTASTSYQTNLFRHCLDIDLRNYERDFPLLTHQNIREKLDWFIDLDVSITALYHHPPQDADLFLVIDIKNYGAVFGEI